MSPPRGPFGLRSAGILHVDMDAFFAAVELRRRPELRDRPVIVGGGGTRSVVMSASYLARSYGIRSAMPLMRALRLCPTAAVVPPDLACYAAVSAGIMEIFRSVTPLVEPISLDEAFLDVGGARRRLGDPAQIAGLIRARVADEQGITCSVGVAPSKFVAKLASRHCKPDGVLVVPPAEVISFLHPLPVGALWGVGERTEEALLRLGVRTVGQLAHVPPATLVRALGRAAGTQLAALAWGDDPRPVAPWPADGEDPAAASVSSEHTFPSDVDDPLVVRRELLRLAERLAATLRGRDTVAGVVTLVVRFADFATITRSSTLRDATDVAQEIYATATRLYGRLGLERARLRLVGIRLSGLCPAGAERQLALGLAGAGPHPGWRQAEGAVDRAARRFGAGIVVPAALLGELPAVSREVGERPQSKPGRP